MRRHQLINAFVYGLAPDDPLDTYDSGNVEHTSQLHVNVERIRVPEVLWQPNLGGLDQAGLGEIIEGVLKGFGPTERERLTSVKLIFSLESLNVGMKNSTVPSFLLAR